MKQCSRCNVVKKLSEFNKNKTTKSGLQYQCKTCRKTGYIQKKQVVIAAAKEWYQANKQKKTDYDKARRVIKAEYLKSYEKQRSVLPHRKQLTKRMTLIRRARLKQRTPAWFGEFDMFVCDEAAELTMTRKTYTGVDWHIDHVEPLHGKYVSGLHTGINLQVIPARDNLTANNRQKRQYFAGL